MIIKGKNIRIGSWALPYVEELLDGNYIHNPCCYLEGRAAMSFVFDPVEKKAKRIGWQGQYRRSWSKCYQKLQEAGLDIVVIPNWYRGDYIYVLRKYFPKLLTKKRLIDSDETNRLYRLENRNLLFRDPKDNYTFEVYGAKFRTIESILVKEVIGTLDRNDDSEKDYYEHQFTRNKQVHSI